jgi:hypothetical protein
MKKLIFINLFFILSVSLALAQMKVEVKLISDPKLIECEPIWISLGWENISKEEIKVGVPNDPEWSQAIKIWINGELRKIYHAEKVDWDLLAPSTLKPGAKIEKKINLRMFNLDNGNYGVKAIADFSKFPPDYFHGIVESNMIEFSIEAPQRIDMQAYQSAEKLPTDNFDKKMSKRDITCAQLFDKNFILSSYPTSLYAGWAIVGTFNGATFTYRNGADLINDLSLTEEQKKEKQAKMYHRKTMDAPGWISPIGKAEYFLTLAEPFVKIHPDSSLTSIIYAKMALAYMVLHHWQDAANALDKCVELGLPPDWSQYETLLKEAKQELIKRGLIISKTNQR